MSSEFFGPVTALVFDMDDTLYPEVDYVTSGFRLLAGQLADPEHHADQLFDLMWDTFLNGPRDRVFNTVLAELDMTPDPQIIAEMVQRYRCHRPDIHLSDSIRQILTGLRSKYKLGVITDGYLPAQKLKAAALELPALIDRIIYTEELGRDYWKPHPRPYQMISEELGCPPGQCVYIGDNPAKDFLAPNRLGWLTIRLDNDSQVHRDNPTIPGGEPRMVIKDLSHLFEVLP